MTPLTIQQRIVDEIKARIRSLLDENGGPLWNNVINGTVDSSPPLSWPVIGIDQGPESTTDMIWPIMEKELSIFIQMRFQSVKDIDSYDKFRYYLGKLQHRLFGSDDAVTLGGLTVNLQELASAPEIEGKDDPGPGGVLTVRVTYRHKNGDPYSLPYGE